MKDFPLFTRNQAAHGDREMSKATKHLRECPAAGRGITLRECGEGRHSLFRCTEDCPHNPLTIANYEKFSKIEGRVIRKAMEFFTRENRGNTALLENYRLAMERGIEAGTAFAMWHFYWARDAAGQTMAERWDARRLDGLENDERAVSAMHRKARPAVVEVLAVTDGVRIECADLTTGERFAIADRALAGMAGRFDAVFAWLVPGPHFHRFLGAAVILPQIGPLEPAQIIHDTARHLGAPEDADERLRWLAEHWLRVSRALAEISRACTHTMYASLDAKFHRTDYRLTGPPTSLFKRLETHADLVPQQPSEDEEAAGFTDSYDWLEPEREEDAAQPELPALTRIETRLPGRQLLGRVLLGTKTARIEASAAARNAALRAKFEKLAAGLVEFAAEKVDDLGAQMAAKHPYDASAVPPHFIEHMPRIHLSSSLVPREATATKEAVKEVLRSRLLEDWPQTPIPALGGLTPRQAAASAEQRPALIRLVKGIVQKADRKSYEESAKATRLIKLLGLHEIAAPTPPKRPVLYEKDDADSEGTHFPDDPPLEQIDEAELDARVQQFIADYPFEDVERLDTDFETLADDLLAGFDALMAPILSDFECDTLLLAISRLYFVLVPGPTERDDVDPQRFNDRMSHYGEEFSDALEVVLDGDHTALSAPFLQSRQPLVCMDAMNVLLAMTGRTKKDFIRPETMPAILAFIASAVDELDCCVAEVR